MTKLGVFVGLFILVIILWVYYLQFHKISTDYKIFVDDLQDHQFLKTGDMILFKAYNNFNSIFHGSYYGHVGIVYILNGTPMLFEANGIERVPLKDHHSKRGVFLTPLVDRIKKYKGRCFWKPLNRPLSEHTIQDFENFIQYCLGNLEYDYAVISGGFKRWLGLAKCGKGTDCGQIVFLSLIKLGLLPVEEYDTPRLHHLKYVCGLESLTDGYKYMPLVEVIDHPFAY